MNNSLPVINGYKVISVIPALNNPDYVIVAVNTVEYNDPEPRKNERSYIVATWWEGEDYWHDGEYDLSFHNALQRAGERAKAPFGRKFYEENATLVNEQAEIRRSQILSKLEEVRPVIKMDRKGQYIA